MKFLVSLILIAMLSLIAGLYMPWWTVSIAAFVVAALIHQKALFSFMAGFLAVFLLWSFLAYSMSIKNDHLLADKMSFTILKWHSPMGLVFFTAFIGALVAGCASLSGYFLRRIIVDERRAGVGNIRG